MRRNFIFVFVVSNFLFLFSGDQSLNDSDLASDIIFGRANDCLFGVTYYPIKNQGSHQTNPPQAD
jgi:hypothetical protein